MEEASFKTTQRPPKLCPLVGPEFSLTACSQPSAQEGPPGLAQSPGWPVFPLTKRALFCSGRSEEPLEGRVQRAERSAATPSPGTAQPRPLSPDPGDPARPAKGALAWDSGAPAN